MGDYLELLRELEPIAPPLFVFGSVAEAVLLDGWPAPPHGDLDVVVRRTELDLRLAQMRSLGFSGFSVKYEPRAAYPMVLGASRDELNLEISVVDFDAGRPHFVVQSEAGLVSISVPDDLFDWPPTATHDVVVHTLSPLALFEIRAGLITTGAFGPPRERDVARQKRLKDRFFPDADEASLQPRTRLLVPS
ncbi:MAG: hypothetical protein ACTHQQ_22030 [Solirubrobacteraceae bacterium]